MELQLGLALPSNHGYDYSNGLFHSNLGSSSSSSFHQKRSFTQLFDHTREALLPTTLSLLPLTPAHPYDDEDQLSNSSTITKNDGEDVMGWPPVNSWMKKLRHDDYGVEAAENNYDRTAEVNQCGCVGLRSGSNTLYVKVKMEGVGIARKVDLRLHHSFQTLKETLMDMFGKCHQDSNCYELAYQDKEGDWLLAEDVPWRSFIECAQRLKLVKSRG